MKKNIIILALAAFAAFFLLPSCKKDSIELEKGQSDGEYIDDVLYDALCHFDPSDIKDLTDLIYEVMPVIEDDDFSFTAITDQLEDYDGETNLFNHLSGVYDVTVPGLVRRIDLIPDIPHSIVIRYYDDDMLLSLLELTWDEATLKLDDFVIPRTIHFTLTRENVLLAEGDLTFKGDNQSLGEAMHISCKLSVKASGYLISVNNLTVERSFKDEVSSIIQTVQGDITAQDVRVASVDLSVKEQSTTVKLSRILIPRMVEPQTKAKVYRNQSGTATVNVLNRLVAKYSYSSFEGDGPGSYSTEEDAKAAAANANKYITCDLFYGASVRKHKSRDGEIRYGYFPDGSGYYVSTFIAFKSDNFKGKSMDKFVEDDLLKTKGRTMAITQYWRALYNGK